MSENVALPLLSLRDLHVTHRSRKRGGGETVAVDSVSFDVLAGETVGLVGESGSGKSSIGRAILGLVPVDSGSVTFSGDEITHAAGERRRRLGRDIGVVFQDPSSSLNPDRRVGYSLEEPLLVHTQLDRRGRDLAVHEMLERVGLTPRAADRYPAEFSGGQRQRLSIARALMLRPRLVICDEPVSALDLSVQAQILNLLLELQRTLDLSYLFISHDLAVVRHVSHRLVVLYRGQVMESGLADDLARRPNHPYTRMLLLAAPDPNPEKQLSRRLSRASGEPASVTEAASQSSRDGCPFAARCPFVIPICSSVRPPLERQAPGWDVACHRAAELQLGFRNGHSRRADHAVPRSIH